MGVLALFDIEAGEPYDVIVLHRELDGLAQCHPPRQLRLCRLCS